MTRENAIRELKIFSGTTTLRLYANFWEALNTAIKALEQKQCNDAISRKWVLDIVNNFVFDTETDRNRIIHIVRDTAPSVMPKQKKGKFKLHQRGKDIDLCCSNCGSVRVEEIAHNYTIDELNKFFKEDFKECLKHPDMSYCPCCGAEMESGE